MIDDILFAFQWNDPLTYFGEMSSIVLFSSIIIMLGFLFSGIFIYLYYKKFYGVTEAPIGWKVFFIGLIFSSLYQLLKIPYTYQWIMGKVFLMLFLIFQVIAIGILVYGLYLISKEIEIK